MSEAQNIRVLLVENDDEDAAIFCRYVAQMKGQQVAVECAADDEAAGHDRAVVYGTDKAGAT